MTIGKQPYSNRGLGAVRGASTPEQPPPPPPDGHMPGSAASGAIHCIVASDAAECFTHAMLSETADRRRQGNA